MRGARLQVVRGEDKGREFYIRNESKVVMGRSEGCDMRLADDEASRKHCVITSHDGEYIVRDLNSTYGVLVNDYPVSKQALDEDDRITVAETDIAFNLVDVPEAFFENKPPEEGGEVAVESEDEGDVEAKYRILDVKCEDCGRYFHNLRWRPGMTCRACNSPNFAPVVKYEKDVDIEVVGEEEREREEIPWHQQSVVRIGVAGGAVIVLLAVFMIYMATGGPGGEGPELAYVTAGSHEVVFETGRSKSIEVDEGKGGVAWQALYCRTCNTIYGNKPPEGQTTLPPDYMRPCPECGETRTRAFVRANPKKGPVKIVPAYRNHTKVPRVKIYKPGSNNP